MEILLLRQIRILQLCVVALFVTVCLLVVNVVRPFRHSQTVETLNAGRINIREKDGTLKAVLSNSAGFNEGQRAADGKGPAFSGLMFYNEEGAEEGGLVFQGKATPQGQDSDVTLTMDQYKQDQNVYLNHSEHKDAEGISISDGLQINSRPDWTLANNEYATYKLLGNLRPGQKDAATLDALRQGIISTRRLFYGIKRGVKNKLAYDDAGLFIKNRLGRDAIRIYVDYENKPHFEVYDELGRAKVYELNLHQ